VRYVPEDEGKNDEELSYSWSRVRLNDANFLDVYIGFEHGSVHLKIVNKSNGAIGELAFALRANVIGLTMITTPTFPNSIDSGDFVEVTAPTRISIADIANAEDGELRLAFRVNQTSIYGLSRIPLELATIDAGKISQQEYRANSTTFTFTGSTVVQNGELAKSKDLLERKIFVVGESPPRMYVSFAFSQEARYVVELVKNQESFAVNIRGSTKLYIPAILQNAADFFGPR
jgi:hypothetical protein